MVRTRLKLVKMNKTYLQGDIWTIRLDPSKGSEIKKTRPCLIISRSKINKKLNTVIIIPFSSGETDKSILQINVKKSKQNGLRLDSHLVIPQIRTVSKKRFIKRLGPIEKKYVPHIMRSFELYFW
ncbi:type II toxin-antitoxin system PemK/MazF family toxin [Candidatus Peregrinibacteria bacterium]|nr:type II toxin-antitoxin system PemK/MazF family toxin [Candidatus Peregrinibacteria bacterium]